MEALIKEEKVHMLAYKAECLRQLIKFDITSPYEEVLYKHYKT